MRFRSEQHVRRQRDFDAVRTQGRRYQCGAFLFAHIARPDEPEPALPARVGVVASRAAVGGAVQRNRAKRRLRETFRRHQELVPPGVDIVLTARRAINQLESTEIDRRFVEVCSRLFRHA